VAILDSFKINLGFIFNEKIAKKFVKFLDSAIQKVKRLSIVLTGLATAFIGLFISMSRGILVQSRLAKSLGTTTKSLIALGRQAKSLTGDRGAGQSLVKQFDDIARATERGNINVDFLEGLERLGIGDKFFSKQDATDRAILFFEAFQKQSEREQRNIAFLTGIGDAGFNLAAGFKRSQFSKDIASQADSDIERLQKFEERLEKVKAGFQEIILKVGEFVLNRFSPFIDKLEDNLPTIVDAITEAVNNFINAVESLVKLGNKFSTNKDGGRKTPKEIIADTPIIGTFQAMMKSFTDAIDGTIEFVNPKNVSLAGAGGTINRQNFSNSQSLINNVDITIQGNADEQVVRKAVGEGVNDILRFTGEKFEKRQ